MPIITALDIERWADRTAAAAELPRLVARLIWATTRDLRRLDMPGGELVRLYGFDGVVQCGDGDDMVPTASSAWELSVDGRPAQKAEKDYATRKADSLGLDPAVTAFVVVTARRWPAAREWREVKIAEGHWRDVRVLASQQLEHWLARAPWIAAEYGPQINGSNGYGVESVGMVWMDYASVPLLSPLDERFILAGRDEVGRAFLEWVLAEGPGGLPEGVIWVLGPSRREVLHYLAATIRGCPDPVRASLESRVFVVNDRIAAERLGGLNPNHVLLVPAGDALPHALEARRRCGGKLVAIADHGAIPPCGISPVRLPAMSPNDLIRGLISLGLTPTKAAHACEVARNDYLEVRRKVMLY